ncbi:hypothetical protein ACFQ5D_05820 [Paenibacillus farraposensis]|uniref:Uncharacterized protein n=1 Tax=Paenibacillus farraposensis TaxID=2807095 RepID=A0ABW4D8A0_9BACL|nr:hypothetical protein [Paenibacillus farraposensis]MCC3380072.1 hypothetical protein [Paenibacillus farraposensis]
MNFISWIFEHLYILAVIGFALISFLGKSKQGTERKSPAGKGMPTFGGGQSSGRPSTLTRPIPAEHRQEQSQTSRQDTGGELQRQLPNEQRGVIKTRRIEEEMNDRTEMQAQLDRESPDSGLTLEERIRVMEEERRMVLSRLDGISKTRERESGEIADGLEPVAQERRTLNADELRRGVIWAEILGPPRSKRYMSKGRR